MATHATAVEQPELTQRPVTHSDASELEHGSIEKGMNEKEDYIDEASGQYISPLDPFPIEEGEIVEEHQVTLRAIIVGCALGAVVGASNIYLGLKTGFTFGPQLFGAIFGYAIIKPMSKALPETGILGRLLGGPFGPKENCTVQSAATSAGGLGILFVSGIPAMYRLNLLSALPQDDLGKLFSLTAASAFFGVAFVIPLRKYYIIRQRLVFPTPTATAFTIRALHNSVTGAAAAKKKSKALLYTFCVIFCFKVATGYAPGIIYDWHIGWTLFRLGFTSIIALENWGWWLEFTPSFFGAGMLSGMNASWSFLGGSILAWGIIGPALVATGKAVGVPASDEFPELISYQALSFDDPTQYINSPSPRYWLLWPGVLMMLVYSFTDIFFGLLPVLPGMFQSMSGGVRGIFRRKSGDAVDEDDDDPVPMADRVPFIWWGPLLLLATIMSVALLATQFSMNVGEAILALVLGFLFSFIGVQSSGQTDVNPISTVAKASQLVFGGVAKGSHISVTEGRSLNLVGGLIAGGAAAQSTDMTGDLKTGYLLRAKPKAQFIAQLCGSVVAMFLTVGLFILFTTASPCIMYPPPDGHCTYGAPSVSAWAAVADAVTAPFLPIPKSSGFTAIGLSIAAIITVAAKYLLIPQRYWHMIPNWNAIGLGFVVPQTFYALAMAIGATFELFWRRRNPANHDMYMFAVSAGLLAGEGLGGVFQAILAVAGVDGGKFGTAIGCPGNEFCG
jgi:OPT family oligopeptide transporter